MRVVLLSNAFACMVSGLYGGSRRDVARAGLRRSGEPAGAQAWARGAPRAQYRVAAGQRQDSGLRRTSEEEPRAAVGLPDELIDSLGALRIHGENLPLIP